MREAHPVKFPVLIALSVLLVGCTDNPLLPELNGRWAPLKGVTTRLVLASNNSSVPIPPPNLGDLCRSEYFTFQKFNASRDFAGAVFLHRNDRREPTLMIAEVKRQGDRITLIGREPFNPLGRHRPRPSRTDPAQRRTRVRRHHRPARAQRSLRPGSNRRPYSHVPRRESTPSATFTACCSISSVALREHGGMTVSHPNQPITRPPAPLDSIIRFLLWSAP